MNIKTVDGWHMTGVSGSKRFIDPTANDPTQNPHSGTWPLLAKLEL